MNTTKSLFLSCFAAAFCAGISTQAQSLKKVQKLVDKANVYQPVYNAKDNSVYVSAARDFDTKGTVYKLDAKTLKVIDSIALPGSAPLGLGINTATQALYTTGRRNLVTAIDLKTGRKTHISSPVPKSGAREVIVDEGRNLIYITSVSGGGGIWVIDGETNRFKSFIYNLGRALTGADLDEKNNILYATAMGDDKIVVVDAVTGLVQKEFDAHGDRPTNVYYDNTKNRLFVANQTSANITVLNAENGELIKAIPTGEGALGVDYNPEKDVIYVANRHGRTVTLIDGTSLEKIKTVSMDGLPNTFAINPKNGNVYVTLKDAPKRRRGDKSYVYKEEKNADAVAVFSF